MEILLKLLELSRSFSLLFEIDVVLSFNMNVTNSHGWTRARGDWAQRMIMRREDIRIVVMQARKPGTSRMRREDIHTYRHAGKKRHTSNEANASCVALKRDDAAESVCCRAVPKSAAHSSQN
jgi:hypothetical protein